MKASPRSRLPSMAAWHAWRPAVGQPWDHGGITNSPEDPGRTRHEADPATRSPSSEWILPAPTGRSRPLLAQAVNRKVHGSSPPFGPPIPGPPAMAMGRTQAHSAMAMAMASPAPPQAPSAWYADPTDRHEYRYWDGSIWTDRVADQGVVASDPCAMPAARKKVTCPAGRYCFGIVGEASYQPALRRISGGRRARGEDVEFEVLVHREPENPYDPNAVCVTVNGVGTVGYFRRDEAARAQRALANLEAEGQLLVCPAFLIGGEGRKYLGVLLDLDFDQLEKVR
jgi:hypothetical protein